MGNVAVSQARIEANRRNAQKSTGPKTEEGKARSRRNGLVHGLAGSVLMTEGYEEAVRQKAAQWHSSFKPNNAFEMDLLETLAVESLRIERCRIEEQLARENRARRAVHCWGDERKAAIERVARGMASRPTETASVLATTAVGCDWLIERWQSLGRALDRKGTWTEDQRTMALDLLGVPRELRDEETAIDRPDDEPEADLIGLRREVVEEQLERLQIRKEEELDEADADDREATLRGFNAVDDPRLVLLRRYEAASSRRLRWAYDQLNRGKARSGQAVPRSVWDPPAFKGPLPTRESIMEAMAGRLCGDGSLSDEPSSGESGGGGLGAERSQIGPDRTQPGGVVAPSPAHLRVGPALTDALAPEVEAPISPPTCAETPEPATCKARVEERSARIRRSKRAAALRQLAYA